MTKDRDNDEGAQVVYPNDEHRGVPHIAETVRYLGCRITVHWSPEIERYRYNIESRAGEYNCGWYLSPRVAVDRAERRIDHYTDRLGLVNEHETIRRIEALATEEGVDAGLRLLRIEDACRGVLSSAVNSHAEGDQ